MQTFKDVLSRKEERENLKNFLFSLTVVLAVVFVFFGVHAVEWMFHDTPATKDGLALTESVVRTERDLAQ